MRKFHLVILVFLVFLLFGSPVKAQTPTPAASSIGTSGYGQILGITLDGPDSDPGCKGAGEPGMDVIPRDGAGTKTFYFSPNSNTQGRCVVIISFRGDPGFADGPVGGGVATVNANQTYTYNFSTLANSGRLTENSLYYRFNVESSTSPPAPSASPVVSPPPGTLSPPPNLTVLQSYCNGATSRVHLEWAQTSGATLFRIFRRQLGNPTHVQIGQAGPGTGYNDETVTPGVSYNYFIQAVEGSRTVNGGDQDIAVVNNCSTTPPPGPFGHVTYSTACPYPNQPNVTISWTAAQYATSYRIYWLDSAVGTQQPPGGIPVGNVTSYTLDTSHGLIPGHFYGFVLAAENAYGSSVTNQSPYSPVAPGGWSHYVYGWVSLPTCAGPGPFVLNRAPTPGCPAFNQSQIQIHWNLSEGATSYKIYPQSSQRGWPVLWPNGYDPSGVFPTEAFFAHNIPPPIPPFEGWEYSVYALNPYGIRLANNASSYYVYGWTMAWNCDIPVVDLKIDGTDVIKTISNGDSITLNYWANNTYTLTTSSSQIISLTSPWRNLYPSNNPVTNPWTTNGSATLTLYNNATYPYSSYQFSLSGINDKIGNYAVSKTVTVNVVPEREPFIQTSQGDVHSNQNISVPR